MERSDNSEGMVYLFVFERYVNKSHLINQNVLTESRDKFTFILDVENEACKLKFQYILFSGTPQEPHIRLMPSSMQDKPHFLPRMV